MNRKEILNELMKKYSFEKAHSIRQIVTEDREFENDEEYIHCWECVDRFTATNDNTEYEIRPIYNSDKIIDEVEIIGFEVI